MVTPEHIPYDPVANNYLPLTTSFATDENGKLCITREQALEDYDYMWKALEENAPYLADLPQGVEEIKIKNRNILENAVDPVSLDFFAIRIRKSLAEINGGHPVGHIYLFEADTRKRLEDTYNPDYNVTKSYNIARLNALNDFVNNPKSIAFYEYLSGGSAQATQNTNSVDYDLEALYNKIVKIGEYNGSPYIKLKSMGNAPAEIFMEHHKHVVGKLQEFCRENKDADNIIIDIRGNGGGSDGIWSNGLLIPLAKEDLTYYDCFGIGYGSLNKFLFQEEADHGKPEDWPDSSALPQKLLDFDMKKYEIRNFSGEKVGFKGKVWLLADEGCYSASESFIVVSKQTGFATVIGTQSGGLGRGGQPWCFPLPNTGALIYYEPWYAVNDDGTCNQIIGTKPDIDVGEQDALGVCLDLIAGK